MSPLQELLAGVPQRGQVRGHGGITVRVLQGGIMRLNDDLRVEPL